MTYLNEQVFKPFFHINEINQIEISKQNYQFDGERNYWNQIDPVKLFWSN